MTKGRKEMMMDKRFENESLKDISDSLRDLVRSNSYRTIPLTIEGQSVLFKLGEIAERIDEASKRDAMRIERSVRDAIVGYQEMYTCAPNDEAAQEVKDRASNANGWLKDHGFNEENVVFDKEEVGC